MSEVNALFRHYLGVVVGVNDDEFQILYLRRRRRLGGQMARAWVMGQFEVND